MLDGVTVRGRLKDALHKDPGQVHGVRRDVTQPNQLIRLHSQKAELVMTNLPLPQLAQSTDAYMTHLEELVHGIERVMLVAGQKDADVITMYS